MSLPPFNEFLGMRLLRADEDGVEIGVELEPHHLNRRGVAHGGLVAALLDSALGGAVVAAIPRAWWCATIQLSTQFVAGPSGGALRATARVVRRGASVAFADGEVRDEAGRLIATAHGSWRLWPSKPGAPRLASSGPVLTLRDDGGGGRPGSGAAGTVEPRTVLCVGRNYAAHVREMNAPQDGMPIVFLKPVGALVPGGGRIPLPVDQGEVHHEVELVAVIGRAGRAIPAERALEHVAGYAVGIDLTLRDVQSQAKQRGEPWTLAKGFDGAAPISTVAPRDEVGDGSGLAIELTVNGELRQQGNTSAMLHGVADLVAHCSRSIALAPGDLIFTGTPEGVSPLEPGDRVRATIERVGSLELDCVAEGDA